MKIGVVMPVMNLWTKYSLPCLESIKTKHDKYIIVVDNASSDITPSSARMYGKAKPYFFYRRNERNLGVSPAWNYGVAKCFEVGCDYVLVINNDVLLHPEMIDNLVERFEKKDEDVVMVTAMDIRGDLTNPTDVLTISTSAYDSVEESVHPNYSAFMINKKYWNTIGEFDEGFMPAYFEDNDSHYRIKVAGLKAITYPPALFYHYGSATQNENRMNPVVASVMFEKNRDYFRSKWGGLPSEEKFTHPFNDESKDITWTTQRRY